MKIALVSPYDFMHPGGVTAHVQDLHTALLRRGHQVKVLAPSSDRSAERVHPALVRIGRVLPVPTNGSVARITVSMNLRRQVREVLEEEQFDVVHLHEPLMPALPVTVLALSTSANVGTFHAFSKSNSGYYYGRPLLRRYFRRLHACVAVSGPARDFVSRYFPADYRVVPNGVDAARFRPAGRRAGGSLRLLFVGRLEKRKGLGYLLRAYLEARSRHPGLTLTVVGDGRLRSRYEAFVKRHRLPGIEFAGHVSNQELPGHYARADIFCAPNTGRESFGIVLLEAMASGLPVVATDIDGFRQVVTQGQTGILVEPKDPLGLAGAIDRLCSDPDLRWQMGERGRNAAEGYDWDQVVDQILDVYQEARLRARPAMESALVHSEVPGLG